MDDYIIYRGYTAKVSYCTEYQIFIGALVGISDIIGFHADDPSNITETFHSTVDDYIDFCRERGIEPGGSNGKN